MQTPISQGCAAYFIYRQKSGFMRAVRMLICFAAMMIPAGLCFGDNAIDYSLPPPFHFALFGGSGLTNLSGKADHGSIHLGAILEAINGSNITEFSMTFRSAAVPLLREKFRPPAIQAV
jgi:hypothetical protein